MAESKIVTTVPSIITVKPARNIALTNISEPGIAITEYTTLNFSGGKLTNSGDAVVIGDNVSMVEISAGIRVQAKGSNHKINLHLYKNGIFIGENGVNEYGADSYTVATSGGNNFYVNKGSFLMPVNAGDTIRLGVNGASVDTLMAIQSYLTVKVVY